MGWGDTLSDPSLWSTIGGAAIGGPVGSGVQFLGNLLNFKNNKDKETQSESEYANALAQQKALMQLQMQLAQQQSAWDEALRSNIMGLSDAQTQTMATAQNSMGAMPQFNPATLERDYQTTKSGMMSDFMGALKMIESQGRSDQIERLGGANSRTADNDRLRSLMKQYAPQLTEIDNAAYSGALQRQTGTMGLFNTNRENTLNEIKSIYQPGITNNTALLSNTSANSSVNNAANMAGNNASMHLADNTSNANANAAILERMKGQMMETFNPTYNPTGNRTMTSQEWTDLMRRS